MVKQMFVQDGEGVGQADVRVDDPPPQPVAQQAGAHPRPAGDPRAAAESEAAQAADGVRAVGQSQAVTRPGGDDGGGRTSTSRGDESVIAQSPGKRLGLDIPTRTMFHARCLGDASSSFV